MLRSFIRASFFLVCLGVSVFAQQIGTPVLVSDAPGYDGHTKYAYVSGQSTYICFARPAQTVATVTYTSISNAASAVVTVSGGHGFHLDSTPLVTLSGGTGSWAIFNGEYKATILSSTTFSIPANTTSAGAISGTVVLKTRAPRTNQNIWMVLKITNSASDDFQSSIWATNGYGNACDNRATLSYQ